MLYSKAAILLRSISKLTLINRKAIRPITAKVIKCFRDLIIKNIQKIMQPSKAALDAEIIIKNEAKSRGTVV